MKLTYTSESINHIKEHDAHFYIQEENHCLKHLTTQQKLEGLIYVLQ